jgi:hypothetical protein
MAVKAALARKASLPTWLLTVACFVTFMITKSERHE